MRSILLLLLVARCLETIDVMYIDTCLFFMSVVVIVWGVYGNACCVAAVVKDIIFSLKSVEVCCLFV